MPLAHREIDDALAAGRDADRRGRHGPVPARRADRARSRPPPPAGSARAPRGRLDRAGPEAMHAELAARAPGCRRSPPADRSRVIRALELHRDGRTRATSAAGEVAALDRGRARTRRCSSASSMERDGLYARIDARVDEMVAAGAADEVAPRRRRGCLAYRAGGARLRASFTEGDVEAMKRDTRQLRQAPAHLDAQARRRPHDRRDRPRPRARCRGNCAVTYRIGT